MHPCSNARLKGFSKELFWLKKAWSGDTSRLTEAWKYLAQFHAQELERREATLKVTQAELDNTTQLLALKNQLIKQLQMSLETQPSAATETPGTTAETPSQIKLRRMIILNNADWLRFREQFEALFPNLLGNLKTQFPDLTAAELRLFMLQKLQFDVTEISEALAISSGSVWQGRLRLTKKLGLSGTAAMENFIQSFC